MRTADSFIKSWSRQETDDSAYTSLKKKKKAASDDPATNEWKIVAVIYATKLLESPTQLRRSSTRSLFLPYFETTLSSRPIRKPLSFNNKCAETSASFAYTSRLASPKNPYIDASMQLFCFFVFKKKRASTLSKMQNIMAKQNKKGQVQQKSY